MFFQEYLKRMPNPLRELESAPGDDFDFINESMNFQKLRIYKQNLNIVSFFYSVLSSTTHVWKSFQN